MGGVPTRGSMCVSTVGEVGVFPVLLAAGGEGSDDGGDLNQVSTDPTTCLALAQVHQLDVLPYIYGSEQVAEKPQATDGMR